MGREEESETRFKRGNGGSPEPGLKKILSGGDFWNKGTRETVGWFTVKGRNKEKHRKWVVGDKNKLKE